MRRSMTARALVFGSLADPSQPDDDIVADPATSERFHRLRQDGKPALIFASHLANWELPALVAARHGLDTALLYRRPNIRAVSDAVLRIRAGCMGTLVATGLDAPVRLLRVLEADRHVAMLTDQHFSRGVDITFFGRRCKANPAIARLARHFDCPVVGVRVIRRPDGGFTIAGTGPLTMPRDAEGRVGHSTRDSAPLLDLTSGSPVDPAPWGDGPSSEAPVRAAPASSAWRTSSIVVSANSASSGTVGARPS